MTRKKIMYVVSNIQHAIAFEWIAKALSDTDVFMLVMLNPAPGPLENKLKRMGIDVLSIHYRGKRDLFSALRILIKLFFREKPDVVHTHLFDASLAGLAAAWLARVPTRIYTRHTSTFHHEYAPGGVKYDRFCNVLSTHIVSISQATDYALLTLEGVDKRKVVRIPHGFVFEDFADHGPAKAEGVRVKWGIPEATPRVGVVARHIEWKGIQYIIPAFREFLKKHPDAVLILVNATGPYHEDIMRLLSDIPKKSYCLIPFEEDMSSMFRLFDMYVHVPVDRYCEAFGQTYIEALACGIPSIFTRSGIAEEFVVHNTHALVVDYRNADGIEKAMEQLSLDEELRDRVAKTGRDYVTTHFGFQSMFDKLMALYHD